jgi:hypothetical protein
MIERNLLDQTKDLRPPQRNVQSNFGMLTEEQRRIAEQGLSQNERVGRDRMARFQIYYSGGKFSRGSGSIGCMGCQLIHPEMAG